MGGQLPRDAAGRLRAVRLAADFNKKYKLLQKDTNMINDSPTMAYMLNFLDGVVDAVKSLGNNLQCEFIAGEINQELSKVRLGTDSRPNQFPRKWTRIWLSNIPYARPRSFHCFR